MDPGGKSRGDSSDPSLKERERAHSESPGGKFHQAEVEEDEDMHRGRGDLNIERGGRRDNTYSQADQEEGAVEAGSTQGGLDQTG